jgi:hypothetical protein
MNLPIGNKELRATLGTSKSQKLLDVGSTELGPRVEQRWQGFSQLPTRTAVGMPAPGYHGAQPQELLMELC